MVELNVYPSVLRIVVIFYYHIRDVWRLLSTNKRGLSGYSPVTSWNSHLKGIHYFNTLVLIISNLLQSRRSCSDIYVIWFYRVGIRLVMPICHAWPYVVHGYLRPHTSQSFLTSHNNRHRIYSLSTRQTHCICLCVPTRRPPCFLE